jgi:hypothetical protein
MMRSAVALVAVLAWPVGASAGPWTPEPGHGYGKVWVKWLYGFGYHAGDVERYLRGGRRRLARADPRLAAQWSVAGKL